MFKKIRSLISSPIFFIFIIPTLLVLIWFKDGYIMGAGESGLPFYSPEIEYKIGEWAWAEFGLGHAVNSMIASKPSYLVLSFLNNFLPGFVLQAMFFWLVLVISGLSVFYLTREYFPKMGQIYFIMAVLYYWFNLFSMVNIWNRFLNNFFTFYALLPLTLLLLQRGINYQKYIYVVLIIIASALLSYTHTSMAFNLLYWFVILLTIIFNLVFLKSKKFILKFFAILLLLWVFLHLWWITQIFSYVYTDSFVSVTSNFFTQYGNYEGFAELSRKLGNLTDLLRLRHGTFFIETTNSWFRLYDLPAIHFLDFITSAFIIIAVVLNRKNKHVLFFSLMFLVGIFLAKGNSHPLGGLLDRLFLHIPFLQLFRNPFEKFGFLLLIPASILFSVGVFSIINKLNRPKSIIALSLIFGYLIIILGYPFFSGLVFTGNVKPVNDPSSGFKVKVPDSYQESADWLNSQGGDFRILVLPLGGEGITYTWEKGYSGVELTNQILPTPAISFNTTIPYYYDVVKDLEKDFLTLNNFTQLLNILEVKYILLRPDVDWHFRAMRDPKKIEENLDQLEQQGVIRRVASFGELSFWENINYKENKIATLTDFTNTPISPKLSDILISNKPTIYAPKNLESESLNSLIDSELLHPYFEYYLHKEPESFFTIDQVNFPYASISPNDIKYSAVKFKESLELGLTTSKRITLKKYIELLSKRIVEIDREPEDTKVSAINYALDYYNKLLVDTEKLLKFLNVDTRLESEIVDRETIFGIFYKHTYYFDSLISKYKGSNQIKDKINYTKNHLNEVLVRTKINPIFYPLISEEFPVRQRYIYQFDIQEPGKYQAIWLGKNLDKYYKNLNNYDLQVDDQLFRTNAKLENNNTYCKVIFNPCILQIGEFNLPVGLHELSLNSPDPINQVDTPDEIYLFADKTNHQQSFEVKNLDPYSIYDLNFWYWIKKGNGLTVAIETNNGILSNGEVIPIFSKYLGPDNYSFEEQTFSIPFSVPSGTDTAKLVFHVRPWNNCESIHFDERYKCKDESLKIKYNKTTEVIIRDIQITKRFTEKPILLKNNDDKNRVTPPTINYQKINSTEYKVDVKDVNNPYVLVLSEQYDPGWHVVDINGNKVTAQHLLVNVYANGWLIDQKGSYTLIVKYSPQEMLDVFEKVSFGVFVLCLLILVIHFLQKNYAKNI